MGQEISQQNKCNIGRRQHQKPTNQQQPKHHHTQQKQQQNLTNCNEKYSKRQDSFASLTPPTIPNKSNRDELHRKQQHLATPHSYVKPKATKKLSLVSNASTTSDYHSTSVTSSSNTPKTESLYYQKLPKPGPINYSGFTQHQRKHSQSNDSGIYYSSSNSSCRRSSSSAASICGSITGSASTTTSCKSVDKQKNYLSHHLYIKSYLDILEEDEKARAHFQPARPGIRNYTPKILSSDTSAATTLSTSAPAATKQRLKIKDDPWI